MEMNHRIQIQNDNHELTYQLKEQKAINADQLKELKRQKEINQALVVENNKLRNQKTDQQLKHAMAGFFGLIIGKVINWVFLEFDLGTKLRTLFFQKFPLHYNFF